MLESESCEVITYYDIENSLHNHTHRDPGENVGSAGMRQRDLLDAQGSILKKPCRLITTVNQVLVDAQE